MLAVTKRVLKQLLALLSLLFPQLLQIRRTPRRRESNYESAGTAQKDVLAVGRQDEYIYTSLFDTRKSQRIASPHECTGSGEDEDRDAEEGLAELVVTLDPITTGFLTDLQLFINICIDKGSYKMKIGVQSASDFLGSAVTKMSLRDLLQQS